jgi:hypothetical protein
MIKLLVKTMAWSMLTVSSQPKNALDCRRNEKIGTTGLDRTKTANVLRQGGSGGPGHGTRARQVSLLTLRIRASVERQPTTMLAHDELAKPGCLRATNQR